MYSLKEEKISQLTPFSVLADNKRIRNKIIEGKSTQETREGYNLLNFNVSQDDRVTVNEDGSITINGSGGFGISYEEITLKAGLNYRQRVELISGTITGRDINGSFMAFDNTKWLNANNDTVTTPTEDIVKNGIWVHVSAVFDNARIKIWGYEGDTANRPYEQYGVMPSPEFPSEIQSVGDDVNLFDTLNDWELFSSSMPITYSSDIDGYYTKAYGRKVLANNSNEDYVISFRFKKRELEEGEYNYSGNFIITKDGANTYYKSPTENWEYVSYKLTAGSLWTFLIYNHIYIKDIKLQKGTVTTAYSEYGKGTVEIKQYSQNLLKGLSTPFTVSDYWSAVTAPYFTPLEDGWGRFEYDNTNGTATIFINAKVKQSAVKLKPNLTYTIITEIRNSSISESSGAFFQLITNNSATSSSENKNLGYSQISKEGIYKSTFLTKPDFSKTEIAIDTYLRLAVGTKGKVEARISIIEGDIDVNEFEYQPYFENNYVIPTTPLRSLPNGVCDTIEEDGIHRRVGSVVLDGSEKWSLYSSSDISNRYALNKKATELNMKNNTSNTLCSHYIYNNTGKIDKCFSTGQTYAVQIYDKSFTTVDELKVWLSENNVEVLYELAEEVIEPFDEEQQEVLNSMETFEGTNYFSLVGDLQTTLTFDYNPQITEEIKRAFKYNITKAYLEVAATEQASGFQINEDNYLQSLDFDDCRYVEGEGIIGSCVAKELQGKFVNVDTSFDIENKELECFIGAETEDNITHYLRLGTFIVQKPENDNVKDNTNFYSLDYMIKFNVPYVHRMAKYFPTKDEDILKDKQYYTLSEGGEYIEVTAPKKDEISTYYEVVDEYTLMELLKDICDQSDVKLGTFNFRNADYVVHGNRFDSGVTCRDVLKAIAQAAFSWARINEYNELLLDFETSDTISEEIDYNEYYNLSFNDKYGPVNTIVMKDSQAEGENITIKNDELIEINGTKELAISDNPFAYSEETRKAIIQAGEAIYGFNYIPLSVNTIGAAYLNCKDKLKIKNMQNKYVETYVFDTRISYQGSLKSDIETLAMTDTETKYRYDGSLTTAQRRTEFKVDKAEQKINSLILASDEQGKKMTHVEQTLEGVTTKIEDTTGKLDDRIAVIENDINGISTKLTTTGGQNLLRNSVGYFGNEYWDLENSTEEALIKGDNSTEVKQNSVSGSALEIQNEMVSQTINEIKNGFYVLTFSYKRTVPTAIAKLIINNKEIDLYSDSWKEESNIISVTENQIKVSIISDLPSSVLITDLILSEGTTKAGWSQNANESYTDNVQIGKGVTITATGAKTKFVAEATGITIKNVQTDNPVAEFTQYGTKTEELVVRKSIELEKSLLIQKIGEQTWFSSL